MRVVLVGLALVSGCYLSHGRAMPDAGLDVGRDAGLDAPPVDAPDGGHDAADVGTCVALGEMVEIVTDHRFRMDVHEVTVAAYQRFRDCGGEMIDLRMCTGGTLDPAPRSPFESSSAEVAVDRVSWCAAASYCAWAGRRLCRAGDEWLPACTATQAHVRGRRGRCVLSFYADGDWGTTPRDVPVEVGIRPECRGEPPFDRVFDVIGNVRELVTQRRGPGVLGSSYAWGLEPYGDCDDALIDFDPREPLSGFRCCAD